MKRAHCFIVFCFALACTIENSDIAGTISDTDTGEIAGHVFDRHRVPARDARVILHDNTAIPGEPLAKKTASWADDSSVTTVTDSMGSFRFENVPPGVFSIEINYQDTLGALVPVTISDDDRSVNVDTIICTGLGVLQGSVGRSVVDTQESGSIYLIEVAREETVDSCGRFVVENLPPGDYTARVIVEGRVRQSPLDTVTITIEAYEETTLHAIGAKTGDADVKGTVEESGM
jgi:hypothetical protein